MTTTYFLNTIMGNVFGTQTTPELPDTYYVGLSSTTPATDGTGVSEPSLGGGYSRVKVEVFGEPEDGIISNTDAIAFAESTSDWGTMTHFVVYDASTGGNLLMFDELSTHRTIEAATIVTIKAGDLKITLANPAV